MENSPTEQVAVTPASVEPTGQEQQQPISAEQNQETNSREQSQGSVSDDTAQQNQNQQNGDGQQTQTQQKGSESTTDDGLAKYAKSQGIDDISELSEREQRFLKIAHDNQKAFREKGSQASIADATKNLGGTDIESRLAQLESEKLTDKFFSDGRDRSLETKMVEILNEKKEQYGKEYAMNLSRDLDALYGLAQVRAGASSVDAEAIRREERESINRQMSATAPTSHATQGQRQTGGQIDENWIRNEYDPRNPEHRVLVDQFYSR